MWPQSQGMYYSAAAWGTQPQPAANPMAQSTDPSDWAQKAAQWAQQKQFQDQQLLQQQQQQQQQQYYDYQQQQQQQQQYVQQGQYAAQTSQYSQQEQYPQYAQQQYGDQGFYQQQQQGAYAEPVTQQAASYGGAEYSSQVLPSDPSVGVAGAQVAPLIPAPAAPSSSALPSAGMGSSPGGSAVATKTSDAGPPKPLFSAGATAGVTPSKGTPPPQAVPATTTGSVAEMSTETASQPDSSVNKELAERMQLFKEQLAQISTPVPSGDDGGVGDGNDGAPGNEFRGRGGRSGRGGRGGYRGDRGGGMMSRGGGGRGGPSGNFSGRGGRGRGGGDFDSGGYESSPRGQFGGRGRGGRGGGDFDSGGYESSPRGQFGGRGRGGRGGGYDYERGGRGQRGARGGRGRGAPDFEPPKRGGTVRVNPDFYPNERGRGRGQFERGRGGRGRGRGGQWNKQEEYYSDEQYGENYEEGGYESQQYSQDHGSSQDYGREGRYVQNQRGFNARGGRGSRGANSGEQNYNRGGQGYDGDGFNREGHSQGRGWEHDQSEHSSRQQHDQKRQEKSGYEGSSDGYEHSGYKDRDSYGQQDNRERYGDGGVKEPLQGEFGAGHGVGGVGRDSYSQQDDRGRYGDEGVKDPSQGEFGAGGGVGRDGYSSSYSKNSDQYSKGADVTEGWHRDNREKDVDYAAQQNSQAGPEGDGNFHRNDSAATVDTQHTADPIKRSSTPRDSLPGLGGEEQTTPKHDGPTIPSLQQKGSTPTVIPGLGAADEAEEESKMAADETTTKSSSTMEEENLKSSLKAQLVDVFGGKAEKMVQSMERIVNQLQTLKGLESSLRVLQEDTSKEGEKAPSTEVDQTEEARKKVAALLATESDSDGENDDPSLRARPSRFSAPQSGPHDMSAPAPTSSNPSAHFSDQAREFDGYDVKPKVFGTYSNTRQNQDSYQNTPPQPQGSYRNNTGAGDYREPGGRYQQEDYRQRSGVSGRDGQGYGDSGYSQQGRMGMGRYDGEQPEGYDRRHRGDDGRGYDYPAERRGGYQGGGDRGYQEGRDRGYQEGGDRGYQEGGGRGYHEGRDQGYQDSRRYQEGEGRGYHGREDHMDRRGGFEGGRESRGGYQGGVERREGYQGEGTQHRDEMYHGRAAGQFREGDVRQWDRQDPDSRGLSRESGFDPAPMDVEPVEEKVSSKLETIDYSHGVSAAMSASRGWAGQGGGDMEQPAIQTVDYNHGQGGGGGGMSGDYRGSGGYSASSMPHPHPAMAGAYGGYASYAGYEGYSGGEGDMSGAQGSGYFPGGVDAATLFAAYNEQTGGGDSKRKALPKWLQEELIKMEKKRQKELAKESQEVANRERAGREKPAWRDEDSDPEDEKIAVTKERTMEQLTQELNPWAARANVLTAPYVLPKSRSPESDEEVEVPARKQTKVESYDEEERKANMLLKLRKMLTEILLEVTNEEIHAIVEEALYEEQRDKVKFAFKEPKFKPKRAVKAPTSVIANLTVYESSSDSDEDSDKGEVTTGAKLFQKPSRFQKEIAKAFEDSDSSKDGGKKKASKWDVEAGTSRKDGDKRSSSSEREKSSKSSSSSSKSRSSKSSHSSSSHYRSSSSRHSSSRSSSHRHHHRSRSRSYSRSRSRSRSRSPRHKSSHHRSRSRSRSPYRRSSHHRSRSHSRSPHRKTSSSKSGSSSSSKSSSKSSSSSSKSGSSSTKKTESSSSKSATTLSERFSSSASGDAGNAESDTSKTTRSISPSSSLFRYQ